MYVYRGGPVRVRTMRAQRGPQGPAHKGPGKPTRAQQGPQGPGIRQKGAPSY